MLMHGVILGGAISLALSLPLLPVTIIINILLVLLLLFFSRNQGQGFGSASAAAMVLSMALASLIMHVKDVPAKDTLNLMWGSPFALLPADLIILGGMGILLIIYIVLNFKTITALFFNQEIAASLGIRVKLNYTIMVMIIALVVALAMKLLGAFLIDSLLILPVLGADALNLKKFGIKKLFIFSSLNGFTISLLGYILAVAVNWPPAATISLLAGLLYIILLAAGKITLKKGVTK
jgi:zinc transport system permease protein